jgi:hypothetical protein
MGEPSISLELWRISRDWLRKGRVLTAGSGLVGTAEESLDNHCFIHVHSEYVSAWRTRMMNHWLKPTHTSFGTKQAAVVDNRASTMSEQPKEGSNDDLGSLGSFLFYVFIVHPATAWILKPGRFERSKSIMYAIAFLAALAAVKTGE